MYNFVKKISKKQWFKVSSLGLVVVFVKFFTSLASSKIMAYFLGPAGIAFIENLRNVFTSVDAVGTIGITTGVTNDILRHKNKTTYLYSVFSTSFWFVLVWSVLVCCAAFILLPFITAISYFDSVSYSFLLVIFSLYPLVVLQLIFQAYLNGFELYAKIIRATIFLGFISLVFNLILIYWLGVKGVLLTMIILPVFLVVYYGFILKTKINLLNALNIRFFRPKLLKRYYKFGILALMSGIFVPFVYLKIRNQIIEQLGWFEAGIWSALTRISSFYILIPATLISYYFLPKLLKAATPARAYVFIKKYLSLVVPLFLLLFIGLYFTANFWIPVILSNEFLSMQLYLKYQFIADFFKIMALIFGYYFIAQKQVIAFIICEILSLSSFCILSHFLIPQYALQGVVKAYLISIILYFMAVCFFFFKDLKFSKPTL